jgi:ribosomal protein S18 acetylase RimI-like enzyme
VLQVSELQVCTPTLIHEYALKSFFDSLVSSGDNRFFHPHDFTEEIARKICLYGGKDYYCLMTRLEEIIAYGMLRGWDEGYEIPSLGIAVAPDFRRTGAGKALLEFLHLAAKLRKSKQVMLKVYKENRKALELFKSFGYEFREHSDGVLIGMVDL